MSELISVIVPVYNVENYLEKCVLSILGQTYTNLEVILVNDGATDKSGHICDELALRDSRIRVIHKQNGGLSDARNVGQLHATGDYILFIDSDDYIHKSMVESLYQQMVKENADVSVCGVMNVYATKEEPQNNNPDILEVYDAREFLKHYLIGKNIPGTICNKLIKKDIVTSLKFPVGKIYEDAFYHYQLIKIAKKYVINTQPYYYYFHRGDSITTKAFSTRDMVYIDIYQQFYNYVMKAYPELEQEAFFRLAYAHFYILDKMLHLNNYQELPEYPMVVTYLRKNALKVAQNPIFQKGRRISALALKCHVSLYRQLMLHNEKKNKQIHQ